MSYRYEYRHEFLKERPVRPVSLPPMQPVEPDPLHPAVTAVLDLAQSWGITWHPYEADLLIHAARDLLGHTLPDYTYQPAPIEWTNCGCRYIALDDRIAHHLTRRIAHRVYPFAWERWEASPHWMAVLGIEAITATLGISIPTWPKRTDPRP